MKLEYTPEERNRLEIEKLQAEVADLRSWLRRWLSSLGGLVGVVAAVVSVVLATFQISRSSREAESKVRQADARLAQAERLEAERLGREATAKLQEVTTQTDAKSKELNGKNAELTEKEARLKEVVEKLARAEEAARALAVAAKPREFSPKALDLIVQFEGIDQPYVWQGGPFGINIGLGYDLGVVRREGFEKDWKPHLTPEQLARLEGALGVTGSRAEELASNFRDIKISRDAAVDVFQRVTLPQYQAQAAQAFPGYERLPLDVQGALISLIYNVGTSQSGRKGEIMQAIRRAVAVQDLQGIANAIRSMKNLRPEFFVPAGFAARLAARREAEAKLVESASAR